MSALLCAILTASSPVQGLGSEKNSPGTNNKTVKAEEDGFEACGREKGGVCSRYVKERPKLKPHYISKKAAAPDKK